MYPDTHLSFWFYIKGYDPVECLHLVNSVPLLGSCDLGKSAALCPTPYPHAIKKQLKQIQQLYILVIKIYGLKSHFLYF